MLAPSLCTVMFSRNWVDQFLFFLLYPWSSRCASGKKEKKTEKERETERKKKLITRTSESVSENKRVFLIRHLDKYKAFVTRVSESFYSFLLFFPTIYPFSLFFFLFRFNYAALVGRDCRKRERERNECRNSQGTLFHHRTFRAFLFYFQNFSLCFFEERDGSIRNF